MSATPNLSLETKHMDINAQIAVVGHSRNNEAKASVRVTTRSGKIRIDVKGKTPGRYIDLDVYSKKGELVLFSSVVLTTRLASSGAGADERSLFLIFVAYFCFFGYRNVYGC